MAELLPHGPLPPENLTPTIKVVLANAARLAAEASDLGEYGRTQTAYFLSVLAREEFAKGFLLILAQEESLPWTVQFQSALRSHTCKQLVSYMLCELSAVDLFDRKNCDKWLCRVRDLPRPVVDAIHVLVHEHFNEREREEWWYKEEDPSIDPTVHEIAAGAIERRKQDLLYVRLGWNGAPRNNPVQPLSELQWENERRRLRLVGDAFHVSEGRLSGSPAVQYPLVGALVRVLAGLLSLEEYVRNWE